MLTRLSIINFAVVSSVELEFNAGMTVVSGETGAGKSLLVDALGFLSGARANSGMVRHGTQRAELIAEFNLDDAPTAMVWLADNDLDEGKGCQLRRTLHADGGSRAWINGRPVSLTQLRALSGYLVEIHGQHEHQALLSRGSQLALLDVFAGHQKILGFVRQMAHAWMALLREQDALSQQGNICERITWLKYQLQELQQEQLDSESITALFIVHRRQAHAASLMEACDRACHDLGSDQQIAIIPKLQQIRTHIDAQIEYEPQLTEVDTLLDSVIIQLNEALGVLEQIGADLDLNSAEYEALEERLTRIHDLSRKHRVAPKELAQRQIELSEELETLDHISVRAEQLQSEITQASEQWRKAAEALTVSRTKAVKTLSTVTSALMIELSIAGRFEVSMQPFDTLDHPHLQGAEQVDFLVTTNPGQPLQQLRKIASGGELSRISLAIEVAALGLDAIPTMIFDEVDSGISGAVAQIVGRKLRQLGNNRQVLCVTHLPQVAAQGHAHYQVEKSRSSGVTHSAVRLLDAAQRENEIARMLGGVTVGTEAYGAARRLLEDVK